MMGRFGQAKREGANLLPNLQSVVTPMTMKTRLLPSLSVFFPLALAVLVLTFTSGCLAVAVGAGASAVAWVRGELRTTVNGNFDKTVAAANKAVRQLEFVKISESKDALLAIIVARNAADKKIQIKIENVGGALTNVKIRVGIIGDEPVSLALLEKIRANL